METRLRIAVDVGGTFTDLVAIDVDTGALVELKVSSTPHAPERAVVQALDELLARFATAPSIEYLAHSTTIATNALLGQMNLELPRVVFVTTAGFRDVIEIGRQNRSEVYNLFVQRPRPLVAREDRIAVRERLDYEGKVLVELTEDEIDRVLHEIELRNPGAIAVGFLHSYANGAHERRLAQAVETRLPSVPVVCSHEIDPEYREYERFSTTVVHAALTPIVRGYIERLRDAIRERGVTAPLYIMQSNGGMAAADAVASRPGTLIESGPASGVIAAAYTGKVRDIDRIVSFDMGGTTAKAGTVLDGVVQVAGEFEAAGSTHSGRAIKGSGYPVRFPFVDLAEISAGGGTIAWIDDAGSLRVGPISAGADPGPACYGKSDRATVTDANVVLGRLNQHHLAGGTFPIDAARSRAAVAVLAAQLNLTTEQTAAGIIRLIDTEMAKVLRIVTVERGLDPRDFVLMAFGGNGALHACALAEELGMTTAIVPAQPGLFSAFGLLVAELRASFVRTILATTQDVDPYALETLFTELEQNGRSELQRQGANTAEIAFHRGYDARYAGQSFELDVEHAASPDQIAQRFHQKHRQRYGYAVEDESVELVSARLTAVGSLPEIAPATRPTTQSEPAFRNIWLEGAYTAVPVHQRTALAQNASIVGPALIDQYDATTYLAPQWRAQTGGDVLILRKESA